VKAEGCASSPLERQAHSALPDVRRSPKRDFRHRGLHLVGVSFPRDAPIAQKLNTA